MRKMKYTFYYKFSYQSDARIPITIINDSFITTIAVWLLLNFTDYVYVSMEILC